MPGPQRGEGAGHIVLVGMMGAGKTTVAALLGERLGRPVIDSDRLIEERAGVTVRTIFERDGEAAFRVIEHDVIAQVLASALPSIVSLGGGAINDDETRRALAAAGTVIWLRARPATLAARVGTGADRPMLVGDPLERITALSDARAATYAEAADVVVEVDDLGPDEVAQRIAEAVES